MWGDSTAEAEGCRPHAASFKATMQKIFGALQYKCLEIYVNDMLVHAIIFALFLIALRAVVVAARRCIFLPLKKVV